ncbi:carbonic anhydrase [Bacillus sp. AFS017336]|uniref:beta-class carbonic anhydrase n=1 Tax=Bacillus sp. AFS017336 TaxID=2033489 RepID=UPI000BF18DAA|nr:carbonic anhydrase [Bacillus sp. AFS017336]PEL09980.1 carbonic anhydrase [Bacillus sp. AFS017336]
MFVLDQILEFNKKFVENKDYEQYVASKFPNKEVVVVTCMDTRLVELLPKALDIHNGDVKMIKTAGAIIAHPFGSVMKSLLVSIYELGAKEVLVIGHHECGMGNTNPAKMKEKMIDRGIKEENLKILDFSGLDLDKWLTGFTNVYDSVNHSVSIIKNHPLIPEGVEVHGLVIDPHTGKLEVINRDEIAAE